jgi:hypothetical protein
MRNMVDAHPLPVAPVVAPLVAPTAPPTISDLARLINEKVAQMVASARTSFTRAIEIGDLLKQAKDRVGHGNFESWVNDHCSFSALRVSVDHPRASCSVERHIYNQYNISR